jgi:hypothetical protein
MLRRSTMLAAVAPLALAATGFVPASHAELGVSASSPAAAGSGSDNVEHVAQLEYDDVYGRGPNQGSDLEFATIEVGGATATHPGQGHDRGRGHQRGKGEGRGPAPADEGDERTFAFAGSYTNGLQIIDVTDPRASEIIAVYDCGIAQGDVQVFERDGRWLATFTRDSGYTNDTFPESACFQEAEALGFGDAEQLPPGTFIVDVTDPYEPTLASFVAFEKGSHNQTVHPSGDYLYNSNSELIDSVLSERGAGIEVVDISDLGAPEEVAFIELPVRPGLGTESHDITFNADGTRAYSAALSQTVIIDTEDPADPHVISSFVDPAINVEHQSDPVTIDDPILGERDFLIVEDEFVGALPTGQCPNGGVHVYDVTGDLEQDPQKVGYWNVAEIRPATNDKTGGLVGESDISRCTAHVFEVHEDEQLMTIAFYNAGVRVVDISGLVGVALGEHGVGMREVASYQFDDSDTWAVKAPFVDRDGVFHIYGNDQARGFDVYEVDLSGDAAASTSTDQWLSPEQALAALPEASVSPEQLRERGAFSCLLPPDA